MNAIDELRRNDWQQPLRHGFDRRLWARQKAEGWKRLGKPVRVAVETQRCLQSASLILSTRKARFMGLRLIFAIKSPRPTMKPACGPPKSLSPEKVTMSAPSAIASATVGSCASPQRDKSIKRPGAKIVDQRHAALARHRGEFARADFLGETLDTIVRACGP